MYTAAQLNAINRKASSERWRVDFTKDGVESNYAINLLSYQEAVTMSGICLDNGASWTRISRQ